jgi:hypothetical protein
MNTLFTFLKKINNWEKIGLIFKVNSNANFSHASVPTAYKLKKNLIRIFFSSRDEKNESNIFFVDYNLVKKKIITPKPKLILKPGEDGLFDDSGVTPSYIIKHKNIYRMYYVGWRSGSKTRMSLFIGLAESNDLKIFKKVGKCPILDRNNIDPFLTATMSILKENNRLSMWYVSGDKWLRYKNQSYPNYNIKYCSSRDGIRWLRKNQIKIDYLNSDEYAIARPSVLKINGIYCMWYCYKKFSSEYRIGFAYSKDNIKWNRSDKLVNFIGKKEMWDKKMKCYPFVFIENKKIYMLYNGNEYGKTGIGLCSINLND